MATATIVAVWQSPDGNRVHAAARVAEGGAQGNVEYAASVANDSDFQALTLAQKKTVLTAALKAKRDEQQAGMVPVAGITGTITL
jgi:folate-dependent phosphoribosylglycinamide formyltransferase PurN